MAAAEAEVVEGGPVAGQAGPRAVAAVVAAAAAAVAAAAPAPS